MSGPTRFFEIVASEPLQVAVYVALSLAVIAGTGILCAHNKVIYQDFFGRINPLLVMVAVSILGFILLTYLLGRGWFAIFQIQNLQGLLLAAGLAALLALAMIAFDRWIVLPQDVNRPFPDFAALLSHHRLCGRNPLPRPAAHAAAAALLSALFKNLTFEQMIWPCILFVALWEPIFQTRLSLSEAYPWTAVIFIALHNFLFNFVQLALFKRYDFVTMYSFRLVYYLLWHIVWGVIRLRVLF